MKLGSILIVSTHKPTVELIQNSVSHFVDATAFNNLQKAFDHIYSSVPDLLICDLDGGEENTKYLKTLKDDPFFTHLPVLVILQPDRSAPDWQNLPVEDYIRREDIAEDMRTKVELCILRSRRVVEVNPLTRLPGNISINRQIQSRLDRESPFALAYTDIDHFKPFNDKYGFSRGDEVIKITGRLLLNIVTNKSVKDVFVGHIGGDDFICIMEPALIEETCREMIDTFDRIVPSFYDLDDREAGYIKSLSREGKMHKYPIMTLSIGIAVTNNHIFSHYGEMTSLASEMKNYAKTDKGSSFRINRRSLSPEA